MSKLADALNFTETSRRQPIMRRMSARVESEDSFVQLGTVWRLDARFGAQVLISDALKGTAKTDYLRKARVDLVRSIVEEVFGEFRAPLMEALDAVYDRDFDAARDNLSSIIHQMFDVE